MSKKLFKLTKSTTMGEAQRFFDSFVVTGVTTRGKRFTQKYVSIYNAFNINLFRGNVWGVKDGKRQKIKSVWN